MNTLVWVNLDDFAYGAGKWAFADFRTIASDKARALLKNIILITACKYLIHNYLWHRVWLCGKADQPRHAPRVIYFVPTACGGILSNKYIAGEKGA